MNLNAAHLHIMLNHFPIVGVVVGTGLLTLWLLWRKEGVVLAALWTFVGSGIAVIPVYLLGDPAKDVVENMPGISRAAIHRHDDAALWVLISLLLLAAASAWILWRRRGDQIRRGPMILGVWVLALVASGITAWAAELGGEIHHPEIKPGWTPPPASAEHKTDLERPALPVPGLRLAAVRESRST